MTRLTSAFVISLLFVQFSLAAEDMKPYPPAESGMERMVFRLPALEEESDRMVEIMVA